MCEHHVLVFLVFFLINFSAKLAVFYLIFYILLAGLFLICMYFWVYSLDTHEPFFQLDDSLIGANPGVGFRPMSDKPEEGSLIYFDAKKKESTDRWVGLIEDFLKPYKSNQFLPHQGRNQIICDFGKEKDAKKSCAVNVADWGNCTDTFEYGFDSSSPCIILKLNRIFGWVPEYYNDTADLPPNMPKDLVDYIKSLPANRRNQIWISCHPEKELDAANLGKIQYFDRGFPEYYFPFKNTEDYLSPLIAIKLLRPKTGVIINFECRAWAKNIIYHRGFQREGSVHIELLID